VRIKDPFSKEENTNLKGKKKPQEKKDNASVPQSFGQDEIISSTKKGTGLPNNDGALGEL